MDIRRRNSSDYSSKCRRRCTLLTPKLLYLKNEKQNTGRARMDNFPHFYPFRTQHEQKQGSPDQRDPTKNNHGMK